MNSSSSTYTIGRDKDCDLPIADESVSRLHAELIVLGSGKLLLKDRSSSNGTSLLQGNLRTPIVETYVSVSDQVQFGSVVLRVQDLVEAIQAKAARVGTGAPLAPATAVLGEETWKRFRAWVRRHLEKGNWREATLVLLILIAAILFWVGDPQSQSFKFMIGIVGSLVASLSFAVLQRYWDRKQ